MTGRSERSYRTLSNLINRKELLKQVTRLVSEGRIRYYHLTDRKSTEQDFGSSLLPSPIPHEGKASHNFTMQIFQRFQCSDVSVLAILLRNSHHITTHSQMLSEYRNGYYSQTEIQFLDWTCRLLLYILKWTVQLYMSVSSSKKH